MEKAVLMQMDVHVIVLILIKEMYVYRMVHQQFLTTNGQCQDRDGCMCSITPIIYQDNCSAFTVPDLTAPVLTAGSVTNTTTQNPIF